MQKFRINCIFAANKHIKFYCAKIRETPSIGLQRPNEKKERRLNNGQKTTDTAIPNKKINNKNTYIMHNKEAILNLYYRTHFLYALSTTTRKKKNHKMLHWTICSGPAN